MVFDMEEIRRRCADDLIVMTEHVKLRMDQRGISRREIVEAIMTGEIIEEYPDDYPHPSCLILGCTIAGRYIHVVVGIDAAMLYLITAYEPDPEVFPDMRTRKRKGA